MVEYDKSVLGVESTPATDEVEKGAIRKFAAAIGDENPLYNDEEYCKKEGFGSLVAPPTFLTTFRASQAPDIKLQFGKVGLHGGQSYEFYKPIKAGDRITYSSKVVDVTEKDGRSGKMVFIVTETSFTNQDGEKVAMARSTSIRRE
jgi:acyl dehydratase